MFNPNFLNKSFSAEELQAERERAAPDMDIIRAGVCALIFDDQGRYFYARHHETSTFPNQSVGTSSEKFRWANNNTGAQLDRTETVFEAWIRCLQEELRIEEGDFIKAGVQFRWANPTKEATPVLTHPESSGYTKAINLFVQVDEPDALVFPRRRGEEILSSGFASLDEILGKTPMRPGFSDWYIEADQQRATLEDQGFAEYPSWIPLEDLSGGYEDVVLG